VDLNWRTDKPPEHGYYIAAWNDNGTPRVSELWYNPDSHASGWWPTRGYMARFVGDIAATSRPVKALTVYAWMYKPEYPLGDIIGYRAHSEVIAPSSVTILREEISWAEKKGK
jgi:hypothetical protein